MQTVGYNMFNSQVRTTFLPMKTISQIKRENMQTRYSTKSYIETMYHSGNLFKYDLVNTFPGSHKCKLGNLEVTARELLETMNKYKYNLQQLKVQTKNMKRQLDEKYATLRRDINEEIDNFQMKFNLELNHQKVKNAEINKDMNELKRELLNNKNLLTELKMRMRSLLFRVDGIEMK